VKSNPIRTRNRQMRITGRMKDSIIDQAARVEAAATAPSPLEMGMGNATNGIVIVYVCLSVPKTSFQQFW